MSTARGFSIIELLIATTILSLFIISTTLLISSISQTLSDSSVIRNAVSLEYNALQQEFANNSQSFLSVTSVASSTQNSITNSVFEDLLFDGITKNITSISSWKSLFGNVYTVSMSAVLTDLSQQPDTIYCSNTLWNEQATTMQQTSISFNSLLPPNLNSKANYMTSLIISSTTLLAIASSTVSKTDPNLFLFTIASSSIPLYEGSIDTSPSTKIGINAAALDRSYVYIANGVQANFATCKVGPSCAQLQIFDSKDPAHISIVSNVKLSATTYPYATGSAGQSVGKSIAYESGRIYLGLSKSADTRGDEFNIIDSTNPLSPKWLGGYHIGRSVTKIRIKGAYAYVVTDNPQGQILLLNISDPTNITQVSNFRAPGNSLYGYGKDITFASTTILLGRSYAQGSSDLFDLQLNPDRSLTTTNSEITATSGNPISVISILSKNTIAYVLTNIDLETWKDLSSPNPTQLSQPIVFPSGTSLACANNSLYLLSNDANGFSTISIITKP